MSYSQGTFLFVANRSIGGIVPDVTIAEVHRDELRITRHPVEQGAAITDHSYKEPPELEMRVGWSDTGGHGIGYARAMYNQLVALQNSRQPFNLSTGKRFYTNCLIEGLMTETVDGQSSSAIVSVRLRQIVIVQLTVTSVPEKAAQANPETAAPTVQDGNRTPTQPPAPKASTLYKWFGHGNAAGGEGA